jgi:hypothetical protein
MEYDYPALEKQFREELRQLEGQTLVEVRLQIVTPEINVVYLRLKQEGVANQGRIGGEVLALVPIQDIASLNTNEEQAQWIADMTAPNRGKRKVISLEQARGYTESR